MLSRLIRTSGRMCMCSVRARPGPTSIRCAASESIQRDEDWDALVTRFEGLSADKLAGFAQTTRPSSGVMMLERDSPHLRRIHALYYVTVKSLSKLETPDHVLPLLALWLSYPSSEYVAREDDHYTQALCRHVMSMAGQMSAGHIASLLSAFRVPHVQKPPEAVLAFCSQWIRTVSPHVSLDDAIMLLRTTANLGRPFHAFHDSCCRRLETSLGRHEIEPELLAECLFALSQSGAWSQSLVSSAVDFMTAKTGDWSNACCYHITSALFNFACLQVDIVQRAVSQYQPDMGSSSLQCLDMLCYCQLFGFRPPPLVNAVRAWLRQTDESFWSTDAGLAHINQLMVLEIFAALEHPNEEPLLSDKQFALFLKKIATELPSSRVATGSIRNYPDIFDFVSTVVGGTQYVRTEVLVFNYVIDMMLVVDEFNTQIRSVNQPSPAAAPLIPPVLAQRMKTCGALSDRQILAMQWRGGAFRAVAIEVCEPKHFLRRTDRVMGNTVLKEQLLSKLGYQVIRVRLDNSGRFNQSDLAAMLRTAKTVEGKGKPKNFFRRVLGERFQSGSAESSAGTT